MVGVASLWLHVDQHKAPILGEAWKGIRRVDTNGKGAPDDFDAPSDASSLRLGEGR